MDSAKTFPIGEVRRVLADGVKREFDGVSGVVAEFRHNALIVRTEEENYFERVEASINLMTDIGGEEVRGWYISYGSRWSDVVHASQLGFVLSGLALIASDLRYMGVPFKT